MKNSLEKFELDKDSAIDYISGRWWGCSVELLLCKLSDDTITKIIEDLEKKVNQTTPFIRLTSVSLGKNKYRKIDEN